MAVKPISLRVSALVAIAACAVGWRVATPELIRHGAALRVDDDSFAIDYEPLIRAAINVCLRKYNLTHAELVGRSQRYSSLGPGQSQSLWFLRAATGIGVPADAPISHLVLCRRDFRDVHVLPTDKFGATIVYAMSKPRDDGSVYCFVGSYYYDKYPWSLVARLRDNHTQLLGLIDARALDPGWKAAEVHLALPGEILKFPNELPVVMVNPHIRQLPFSTMQRWGTPPATDGKLISLATNEFGGLEVNAPLPGGLAVWTPQGGVPIDVPDGESLDAFVLEYFAAGLAARGEVHGR
ncbi:MAG: hypothetical protein AB7N71_02415 [Phycisphaerae bacterium]